MKVKRGLLNMTDKDYNDAHDALSRAGWNYRGCDNWIDPQTDTKLTTSVAIKVLRQREKRERILKGIPEPKRKPRLVMCDNWRGIAAELRKQLKPFGITIKTRTSYQKWGDRVDWEVQKLVDPMWESHRRKLNRAGIDPWNNYT